LICRAIVCGIIAVVVLAAYLFAGLGTGYPVGAWIGLAFIPAFGYFGSMWSARRL
jgi:hypothetical protein